MREKDKGRSLWHGESVKQGQTNCYRPGAYWTSISNALSVSPSRFYSPFLALLCLSQGLSGLHSSEASGLLTAPLFCSSIQTKGEKWGQSGQWGFAKGGAGGWSIFFCTCESQKLLIVISVTALTTAAQTLKQTAATLQTEREIWERASKIETPSKKTSV